MNKSEELIVPEGLVGKTSGEVVLALARRYPQIKNMDFVRYFPWNNGENVDLFWHFSRDEVLSDGKVEWLISPELQTPDSLIGFTSLMEVDKPDSPPGVIDLTHEYQAFPMLLFTHSLTDQRERIDRIKEFLRSLGQTSGLILKSFSDYGYYYCGLELLPMSEWGSFMKKAQEEGKRYKYNGLLFEAYINRALIPPIIRQTVSPEVLGQDYVYPLAYATLRLSTNSRKPDVPWVVDIL